MYKKVNFFIGKYFLMKKNDFEFKPKIYSKIKNIIIKNNIKSKINIHCIIL
jgi:hypothetical protein